MTGPSASADPPTSRSQSAASLRNRSARSAKASTRRSSAASSASPRRAAAMTDGTHCPATGSRPVVSRYRTRGSRPARDPPPPPRLRHCGAIQRSTSRGSTPVWAASPRPPPSVPRESDSSTTSSTLWAVFSRTSFGRSSTSPVVLLIASTTTTRRRLRPCSAPRSRVSWRLSRTLKCLQAARDDSAARMIPARASRSTSTRSPSPTKRSKTAESGPCSDGIATARSTPR